MGFIDPNDFKDTIDYHIKTVQEGKQMGPTEEQIERPKKQYAYWHKEDGVYMTFECIADAVHDSGDENVEVFEVTYKPLGKYRVHTSVRKVRGT